MKNFIFALALLAVTSALSLTSLNSTASNAYSTYEEAWKNCVGGEVSPRYQGQNLVGYACVEDLRSLNK